MNKSVAGTFYDGLESAALIANKLPPAIPGNANVRRAMEEQMQLVPLWDVQTTHNRTYDQLTDLVYLGLSCLVQRSRFGIA